MASNQQQFPHALIMMIIDEGADDILTLKQLALVSRACLLHSRKHFLHSINLSSDDTDPETRRIHRNFHQILVRNPDNATYIRELRIMDNSAEFDPPESPRPSWIRDEPSFCSTLRILSSIGRLERFTFYTTLYWDSFPLDLKNAFIDIFRTESLIHLGLHGLRGLPMSCCGSLRQIREITMQEVELEEEDEGDPVTIPHSDNVVRTEWMVLEMMSPPSLEMLYEGLLPSPPDNTRNPRGKFSQLRGLQVGPEADDEVLAIWDLMRASTGNLESFSWEYTYRGADPPCLRTSPIDLSIFPKLRMITFQVTRPPLTGPNTASPDPFEGLLTLLETVHRDNIISSMLLIFNYLDATEASEQIAEHNGWGRLNEALSHPKFIMLQGVQLNITLRISPATSPESSAGAYSELDTDGGMEWESQSQVELERLVRMRMSALDEAGKIDVCIE